MAASRPWPRFLELEHNNSMPVSMQAHWQHYTGVFALVAFATIARAALDPVLGNHSIYSTYFLAIMVAGWICGLGPSLFSLALSALAADYFFVPPRGSLQIQGADNLLGLGLFIFVNIPIVLLVASLRASRKEAEDRAVAVKESQERFQRFMDQIPLATWIKKADGRLEFVNRHFEKMAGLVADQILGRTIQELFGEAIGANRAAGDRLALNSSGPVELNEQFALPDGSLLELITLKFTIPGPGGEPLIGGAAIDVTRLREVERSLRESEERFHLFMNNSPLLAWMKNQEGRYTYINKALCASLSARGTSGPGNDRR